jgi:ABC-type branched-subunit amino acid transport system permease subunit
MLGVPRDHPELPVMRDILPQLTFWEALPFSILLSALIACGIGLIVLRLRGDYLAIVTLGFGETLRIVLITAGRLTGGPNGILDSLVIAQESVLRIANRPAKGGLRRWMNVVDRLI